VKILSDNILEIKDFSVNYGKSRVLKNINLEIEKNRITAIIGPSGCGKSTFLKSLNLMITEEKSSEILGKIYFNGKNIKDFQIENLRKKIGLVFQTPTPFPFSIYKNMIYAPVYYGIKDKKELDKIMKEKLVLAGLYDEIKDEMNKSALSLSGGQQQRLCIARELTVEPEILLLDEPCSALDIQNTMKIEEMLKNLSSKYTIVIVTHNLAQAKRIADKTAFFFDGELVEYGDTEDIFTNPKDEKTKNYINGIFG
jgi:phosphate transport system ATP-binding protein